jgi:alpha-tubulin suppressor-like RCC1 family protein
MPFIKNLSIFARKVVAGPPRVVSPTRLSGGDSFSVFIKTTGRVFGWGSNTLSQLGDNTVTQRLTPVSVVGAVKTFCQITSGNFHAAAIDKNGRAWAWGNNGQGQLGDNTITTRGTPVSVLGGVKTFCLISAGNAFSVAIEKNGRVWGWGNNFYGQLGDGTSVSKRTPVSVGGTTKTFCEIATSKQHHTVAIDRNGRAWGWGWNVYGQLGDNTGTSRLTPVSVVGAVKTFCKIAAGFYFTVALDKNGRAWGWGYNANSQLGDNSTTQRLTPVSVLGATKTFCKIAAGAQHTVAITRTGRAWAWGDNQQGQLGDGTEFGSRRTPVSVAGAVKTFCDIKAGESHTLALDKNGNVWAWGTYTNGRLGNNTGNATCTPLSVRGTTRTFCQIGSLSDTNLVIDKNGRAWGWGPNSNGQIGDNTATTRHTPVSVAGTAKTFCQISVGYGSNHAAAIDRYGRVWSWGNGSFGALGVNNAFALFSTPVSILGAPKIFCKISGGYFHTMAITNGGRLWGWGLNFYGALGDNSTVSKLTPVSVLGATKTFCEIYAGNYFTVALEKNGRVWSWGYNNNGQLGDNSITSRLTPVSIAGATKTFCKIGTTLGVDFVNAIDKNGRVWSWGSNILGQLGDNTTLSRRTPVAIVGNLKTFCHISSGLAYFAVALDNRGRAWAWGNNGNGQLGDNTVISRRTPVSVLGAIKTFCKIFAGNSHVTAIDKNGRIWTWGGNISGQLGINEFLRRTPVRVCTL